MPPLSPKGPVTRLPASLRRGLSLPFLFLVLLVCLLASCGGDGAEGGETGNERCGLKVALSLDEINTTEIGTITIRITRQDGTTQEERSFSAMADLTDHVFYVPLGSYTVRAVTSRGYSGSASVTCTGTELKLVTIRLTGSGTPPPVLRLRVSLPDANLTPFGEAARTNGGAWTRRVIADVFPAGSDQRLTRTAVMTEAAFTGTILVELPLDRGSYDIRLWSDFADAGNGQSPYYDTEDLEQVKIRRDGYEACSDYKDAAYATLSGLAMGDTDTETDVTLERPLAKYRLVATDMTAYEKLEGVPPLEDLLVRVDYEGFFPSSFNVVTGKPNDSVEGLSYTCQPSWQTDDEGNVNLAADWVMVNGTESSVNATISLVTADGRVVSQTKRVAIHYKRGQLTTVSGKFLTAGHGGGGANIDTGWDDNTFEVEF